ncbi:MAG: hypothetical protein VYE73_11580 [Acidobacteriota bacterium]|nr:hypothetical protein [Acidobacteriota bacterium]
MRHPGLCLASASLLVAAVACQTVDQPAEAPLSASLDGPGVPPDIEVAVFRQVDLDSGRDPALEKAMELLSKGAQ